MGSGYFGELKGLGNERGPSSSSSSRKGKNKSSSEKPKQPQRGLGVAQLEKIRLHGELNSAAYHYPSSIPTNFNQEDQRVQAAYSSIPSSSFSYSTSSTSPPSNYGFQYPAAANNVMMGIGHEYERANIRFSDSQAATTASWYSSSNMLETQQIAQPSMTRELLSPDVKDSQGKRMKKHRSKSVGSSSQNYGEASDENQELDLELRLSL